MKSEAYYDFVKAAGEAILAKGGGVVTRVFMLPAINLWVTVIVSSGKPEVGDIDDAAIDPRLN